MLSLKQLSNMKKLSFKEGATRKILIEGRGLLLGVGVGIPKKKFEWALPQKEWKGS